jgi:hypothetical protein
LPRTAKASGFTRGPVTGGVILKTRELSVKKCCLMGGLCGSTEREVGQAWPVLRVALGRNGRSVPGDTAFPHEKQDHDQAQDDAGTGEDGPLADRIGDEAGWQAD